MIDSFGYTYDAAGQQVSSTSHLGGTVSSAYDGSGEVTSSGANSYSWDAEGNPTGGGYSVNADNELTATPTDTLSYDNEGELTEDINTATGDTWFYGYNNAGNMISAQEYTAASSGTLEQSIVYAYDAFGNRVEETVTTGGIPTATLFAYDGWNPATAGSTGNSGFQVWATFAAGPFGFEIISTRYLNGDSVDQVLGRIDSTLGPAWLLTDSVSSVRDVIDGNGLLRDNIQYNAFGQVISQTQYSSGGTPTSTTPQTDQWGGMYTYAGMIRDVATGLYHDNARDYSSSLGRFDSQDPTGFAAGDSNLYRYVNNAPTDAVDPSGDVAVFFRGFPGGSSGKYSGGSSYASGQSSQPGGSAGSVHSSYGRTPADATDDYPLYKNWVDAMFDYQDVNDAVKFIIKRVGPPGAQKEPIALVGHSYGATSALAAAKILQEKGYSVDFLATLDPITNPVQNIANGTLGKALVPVQQNPIGAALKVTGCDQTPEVEKPANVLTAWNWFQTVDIKGMGTIVKGAENFQNVKAGEDIPQNKVKKGDVLKHTDLDDDKDIAKQIEQQYQKLLKSWKAPVPPPPPAPPSVGTVIWQQIWKKVNPFSGLWPD